jgi:hypothetical protein
MVLCHFVFSNFRLKFRREERLAIERNPRILQGPVLDINSFGHLRDKRIFLLYQVHAKIAGTAIDSRTREACNSAKAI